MPGAVETVINRHIVGFHEIPVAIEQAFLCRLIPDLVQGRLVHLTESDIRVVKHGKGIYASPSRQMTLSPFSSCTKRERTQLIVGLVVSSILGVLNVSWVLQRRRENSTSTARSEISDTSSTMAMVYSEEPKRSKLGSLGISAISFMMMTESFQNVSVPSRLFIL